MVAFNTHATTLQGRHAALIDHRWCMVNPLEDDASREGEDSVVVYADAFALIRIDTNVNIRF